MGVNANPRVRVTAVIGDTSKTVHGRRFSGPDREYEEAENKAKASQNARLSRGGLKNDSGFQLAV
jgi:hypothetical protein